MSFLFSHAQERTVNGWLVLMHEQQVSNKWSLLSDVQIRSAHQLEKVQTVLLRPAIQFKLNNSQSAALGYAYLGNWEREEGKKSFEQEHRIWEQVRSEDKLGNTEVTNRLRLEQRFVHQDGAFEFSQRLRYYVRFEVPVTNRPDGKPGIFVGLQNEVFLNVQNKENVNGKLFDQNRAFAGIGRRFNEHIDIEAGYMYRYQIDKEKMHNHIFQLTVTTTL